ncbi:MAG: carboxypeptidase regulatory-like domain-containing protein, partial [Gemmatimonadaceae bacterium]
MGPFVLRAVEIALALQAAQATVFGGVREAGTGEPLAGAVVSLADLNRATSTGADGRYVLRQVPAGPQHLTIRLIGHAPRTLHALVPAHGELEINVALDRTPVQLTTVEVAPRVIVRGVDSAGGAWFPDRSAPIAAIRNHPLLAEPDALQALGGGEVVMRAESPSGVHVRGGASDHTAYLLDGIPVFSPYHSAGVFSAWNPDALHGVHLSSSAPSPAYPDALSGVVEAVTRTPGAYATAQGSVSSTQARITVDGPLGVGGAGYLLSLRSAFPGSLYPSGEPSYLRGEAGDWLAKLELSALGGRLRLLGFESGNEVNTAAATSGDAGAGGVPVARNTFEWHGRSLGVEWRRELSGVALRVVGWRATGDAGSVWAHAAGRVVMG